MSAKRRLVFLYRELGMVDEAEAAKAGLRARLALADPGFWTLRGLREDPEPFDTLVPPSV